MRNVCYTLCKVSIMIWRVIMKISVSDNDFNEWGRQKLKFFDELDEIERDLLKEIYERLFNAIYEEDRFIKIMGENYQYDYAKELEKATAQRKQCQALLDKYVDSLKVIHKVTKDSKMSEGVKK